MALLETAAEPVQTAQPVPQTRFSSAELLADDDYAAPHIVHGRRLHGGFDADGRYLSPRAKGRRLAIDNWTAALHQRGGDLLPADRSLLSGPRVPNVAQQRSLIESGVTAPFWNGLTITGKIEGRGRMLAQMPFPDLRALIVEDIDDTALGHLTGGLLVAHGIDEGGQPELGIGGHDEMWFLARDLAFGEGAHEDVEPPAAIGRPDAGERRMPEIPAPFEQALGFLMNLLLIEFRAEIGFAAAEQTFRTPTLFTDRRAEADEAAVLVDRIRTDEQIHVESLRLYLGELSALTLRTEDGGTMPGAALVDRYWAGLVRWATVEQPRLAAQAQAESIHKAIGEALPGSAGETVAQQFDALADPF